MCFRCCYRSTHNAVHRLFGSTKESMSGGQLSCPILQWIQNFRMSRETFPYICHCLKPAIEKLDKLSCVCTSPKKSLHDARVLRLSALWEMAERRNLFAQQYRNINGQDVGLYILGDAAYPLTSWLMKPFPDNGFLTAQQQVYNHKTSRQELWLKMHLAD